MTPGTILVGGIWAGLFSACLGVFLTAPSRYVARLFLCGFAGKVARDLLIAWGLGQNLSTLFAAAVVVLVGVTILRGHKVSPVILVTGILPLGASVALFNAIVDLMRVSTLKGDALAAASADLSANLGKVFTGSLAIALGLMVGMLIVRSVRREEAWDGA